MGQWCWELIPLISQGSHRTSVCSCTGAKLELEPRLLGRTSGQTCCLKVKGEGANVFIGDWENGWDKVG